MTFCLQGVVPIRSLFPVVLVWLLVFPSGEAGLRDGVFPRVLQMPVPAALSEKCLLHDVLLMVQQRLLVVPVLFQAALRWPGLPLSSRVSPVLQVLR